MELAFSMGGQKILLCNNATTISKQAREYSSQCKDVAVFDRNSLFVFDFSNVNEQVTSPRPVRGTFFQGVGGDHEKRHYVPVGAPRVSYSGTGQIHCRALGSV